MIPRLDTAPQLSAPYLAFLDALKAAGFRGDIETRYSERLSVATDNSVYQLLPQALVLPKDHEDVLLLARVAKGHPQVQFSARGGGTGTNGQSLNTGLVVDMSRHMRTILEFNAEEGWVRVQAGVIKDQLNDFLRPHGFFFAPDLSTSNRATVGGMVSTDASGQGSLVYGKTSDHVLGLRAVLVDGEELETRALPLAELERLPGRAGQLHRDIAKRLKDKRAQILETFPRLNRFLTGYDLEHVYDEALEHFDLGRLICGAEGSLAFVTEAKLHVNRIEPFKTLINIKYDSFEKALRNAPFLVAAKATSVETVDSKVLSLAREDIIWHQVKDLISEVPGHDMQGLNIVEFNDVDEAAQKAKVQSLCQRLDEALGGESGIIGYQLTSDLGAINRIYAMRKKSVGLLGNTKGSAKPQPFAEDTAVPPQNLADFILEFRALLDAKGLHYGMFGHVDAGVLHVRPALDLCDPQQELLLREISDQVVALVAKYGGLMWGEHGKGFRSEYAPTFFGELWDELRWVKSQFDPDNRMNPGKICTPLEGEHRLVSVDGPKRGALDRQIPVQVRDSFSGAMSCNGNGLCFNYDATSPMCPSYRVTGDRRHSPKGRAGLVREWLRLLAESGVNPDALEAGNRKLPFFNRLRNSLGSEYDFSREVKEAMDGCLACKACSSQCPIKVDVPSFRARFMNLYHQRYLRPLKDHLVANVELSSPLMARWPKLVNALLGQNWFQGLLKKTVGMVDSPLLSAPTLKDQLAGHDALDWDLASLASHPQKDKLVLVVQDPFTSFYDAKVVADLVRLIEKLGFVPKLLPFKPNGKPEHVKGFLARFNKTAQAAADFLNPLHALGLPLVGVDPSLVLCYRDEYRKALGDKRGDFQVLLAQEWLAKLPEEAFAALRQDSATAGRANAGSATLFAHCTEKTAEPTSEKAWQQIFDKAGLSLSVASVGCCGMAGTYGHEAEHQETSKALYELSWRGAVAKADTVLATGYSCRCQVGRMEGQKPLHPVQWLLEMS
ncbi:FAD-binding and (Fe-S)-binding domain-containing protein [Gallaecimonas kandeliae]|uniref:D-2-hydroxyglutarate dehydrogenase YdiJ n=1 Tax=Gallaecimonas kandeliae TaxID=3029055 RepID=UPI00264A473A|nr:FAD-binding and (Fe-S)-binding domain-containing protein [Gallaecimonas kandeliae]WKE67230.1 FAD-binding and (Fe-S)-binding domain-containing protein [Gallaecimonas kandeliae]